MIANGNYPSPEVARRCHGVRATRDFNFSAYGPLFNCTLCTLLRRSSACLFSCETSRCIPTLLRAPKGQDPSNSQLSIVFLAFRRSSNSPHGIPMRTCSFRSARVPAEVNRPIDNNRSVVVSLREYVHPSARRKCFGPRLSLCSFPARLFLLPRKTVPRRVVAPPSSSWSRRAQVKSP